MKRITWVAFCLLAFIFLSSHAFAIEDYSPTQQPAQSIVVYDPSTVQTAASISRIESKLETLQKTADSAFKASDIEKLKQELNADFDERMGMILGRMLSILLVWSVFFFAMQFLMKAKGWI